MTLLLGNQRYRLVGGRQLSLRLRVDSAAGPWSVPFTSAGGTYTADRRPISVRSSLPIFVRDPRNRLASGGGSDPSL